MPTPSSETALGAAGSVALHEHRPVGMTDSRRKGHLPAPLQRPVEPGLHEELY
jgi:hypothetical protein